MLNKPKEGGSGQKSHHIIQVKENIIQKFWFICAFFAVIAIAFILFFLINEAYPAFYTIGPLKLITGTTWDPTRVPPEYGMLPLIVGTILVTLGAMIFAIPLSLASALYISILAPYRVKLIVKPIIELLAGIPSVIYGFIGLILLTTWIMVAFNLPTGETWLAGSIILGIMAIPTITSVAEDAISAVPREYNEGSLGLGATKWQTISRVIIPSALSGITAAIILGLGRAVGETMAVLMVTGNAAVIPDPIWNIFSPIRTLTGTLGIEMGEVAVGSLHYNALFAVAVVLLVITLIVNILATFILDKVKAKQCGTKNCSIVYKERRKIPGKNVRLLFSRISYRYILILFISIFAFFINGLYTALFIVFLLFLLNFIIQKTSQKNIQKIIFVLIYCAILFVIFILGIILFDIFANGIPYISWEFLTGIPTDLGRAGGIFPAIVGTLYLVSGAILISLPIGIGAAIYLIEYTREGKITKFIRVGSDLLNGTPSIVFGLFGFAFLVLYLNFGVSLIAGQITLALMVLPTIIRTTEESLKSVPVSFREGSLALGATKWQTIRKVVLPPAIPGIITGTILSLGRAAGETAPIMFTAVVFTQRNLPNSLFSPVMALPYHLFILSTNVPGAQGQKYGTAVVLLVLVIFIYALAIIIRNHYHKTQKW